MEYLYIQFNENISEKEVPLMRGAFIDRYGDNELFHNHVDNGLRYIYPLIQYKRIGGRAAVLGLNEGAQSLVELAADGNLSCYLGRRRMNMRVQLTKIDTFALQMTDAPVEYTLTNWLPLNQRNYRAFKEKQTERERMSMLTDILKANILSFAKGMRVFLEQRIECEILDIGAWHSAQYKDVELESYDLRMACNVSMPDYIGLGKAVSKNFGVIKRVR